MKLTVYANCRNGQTVAQSKIQGHGAPGRTGRRRHSWLREVGSPKRGSTTTQDWLLTFLAHQEERDAKREERHEATTHMLCEAFSGRSRHTSPAEIVNELSTENNPVGAETAPITQRAFSGARAKARAPHQMPADITLRDLSAWCGS